MADSALWTRAEARDLFFAGLGQGLASHARGFTPLALSVGYL